MLRQAAARLHRRGGSAGALRHRPGRPAPAPPGLGSEPLQIVFDQAHVGIRIVGLDGRAIRANPAFCELTGYSEQELRDRRFADFTHPDDRDENLRLWEALRDGGADRYRMEKRYLRPDGAIVWSLMQTSLVRDALGRPQCAVVMDSDMTEHRRLEEQLSHAQKMEAVGRLAGGIAHDFNNLLTAILGCAHLLLRDLPEVSHHHAEAQQIVEAAERAAALTSQLLTFGRRQVLNARAIDVNEVVRGTAQMLDRLLAPKVRLELALDADLWPVRADPTRLDQVVLNLALNARDAMPDGGTLRITTANAASTGQDDAGNGDGRASVLLTVEDEGSGVDESIVARIFEPFFTTKADGGTGLGLAMVHSIVEQSGGSIRVEARPDRGTRFIVELPRSKAATPAAAREAAPVTAATRDTVPEPATLEPAGAPTILLVDDEHPVRRLTGRILADAGYTVLDAASGREALAIAAAYPRSIDLLLTDVRMPNMSGPQLAQRLCALRPETRLLYISGYAAGSLDESESAGGGSSGVTPGRGAGTALLEKPFTPDTLEAAVLEALAGPPPAAAGRPGDTPRE